MVSYLDCCVSDIWHILFKSQDSEGIRKGWVKLAERLGLKFTDIKSLSKSMPVKAVEKLTKETDPIARVLYKWTKDLTTTPRLDVLVNALELGGFKTAAGSLILRT